jgi:hypothetical protein
MAIRTLIETMPAHLCGSHKAAGNWGSYPFNGAERRIVDGDGADELADNGYDEVVRVATEADERRYGDPPAPVPSSTSYGYGEGYDG